MGQNNERSKSHVSLVGEAAGASEKYWPVNTPVLVSNTKRKMFIDTIKAPIFLDNFCYKLI